MLDLVVLPTLKQGKALLFSRHYQVAIGQKAIVALLGASIVGMCAQIKVFLPFTPIPVTGQTFAVLLTAILLGKWWGGISQFFYVILGILGVPWFVGGNSGLVAVLGPTGGYLLGFIFAALFIGYVWDSFIQARSFLLLLGILFCANFIFIHGLGLLWLQVWFVGIKHFSYTLGELFMIGTGPFILGDILKIFAAASVATSITFKVRIKK